MLQQGKLMAYKLDLGLDEGKLELVRTPVLER